MYELRLNYIKGLFNNILAFGQIMDWRRPGDKSLSEPKMASLLTYASLGFNELTLNNTSGNC